MDDGIKHREQACRLAQKGDLGLFGAIVGGGLKEFGDIVAKYTDKEKCKDYGGFKGIFADSVKDMNNNIKGAGQGYVGTILNKNVDCEKWAKKAK